MRDICSPCGRDVPSYASEGASSQACGWSFASSTGYIEGVSLGLAGPSARAPIQPGPEGRGWIGAILGNHRDSPVGSITTFTSSAWRSTASCQRSSGTRLDTTFSSQALLALASA